MDYLCESTRAIFHKDVGLENDHLMYYVHFISASYKKKLLLSEKLIFWFLFGQTGRVKANSQCVLHQRKVQTSRTLTPLMHHLNLKLIMLDVL